MQRDSSGDARIFFVHVQKTGGTSLIRRMQRRLGEGAVYPNDTDGDIVSAVISVERLLERWQARRNEIRVVTGHFPLCTADLLGGAFRTVTLLREPVERTLSYLRHHRVSTSSDRDLRLDEIYDDPFRFRGLVHNHMVKMFSLTPTEMTRGVLTEVDFTPERLDRAKENLARVDVVGLSERYDEFWEELTDRFGLRLGPPQHVNRTDPVDVPDGLRERIVQDNALDVQLYEFARRLHAERRDARSDDPAPRRAAGTVH